jgi:hypothetical protein
MCSGLNSTVSELSAVTVEAHKRKLLLSGGRDDDEW